MQNFVISTQFLENYGAHSEDGKFASGNAHWRMKGGTDYLVSGLDRIQDAVAFVAAQCMANEIGYKEFPVSWKTESEWLDDLPDDEDYSVYILDNLQKVNPNN